MLYQTLPSLFVDLACYGRLAIFRPLVPDVGEPYRDSLAPELAATVDEGVQKVLTLAEQTADPRAVWRQGMETLIKLLASELTLAERRDFVIGLMHELDSPRFTQEKRKIRQNPELLASRIVRNHPVAAEADALIQQAFFNQIATGAPPDLLHDERKREALSAITEKILHIADAVHAMKTPDGVFPWQTTREFWSEADKRAREKARWDGRKTDDQEKPWGDMARVSVRVQDEETVSEKDRERLQKKQNDVEAEIIKTCRPQKARNYFRLVALLYEEGKLVQNRETADRAKVSLRTLQTFIGEGRKKGWLVK